MRTARAVPTAVAEIGRCNVAKSFADIPRTTRRAMANPFVGGAVAECARWTWVIVHSFRLWRTVVSNWARGRVERICANRAVISLRAIQASILAFDWVVRTSSARFLDG